MLPLPWGFSFALWFALNINSLQVAFPIHLFHQPIPRWTTSWTLLLCVTHIRNVLSLTVTSCHFSRRNDCVFPKAISSTLCPCLLFLFCYSHSLSTFSLLHLTQTFLQFITLHIPTYPRLEQIPLWNIPRVSTWASVYIVFGLYTQPEFLSHCIQFISALVPCPVSPEVPWGLDTTTSILSSSLSGTQ